MPSYPPPWSSGEVRDEYAAGTWAYALGRAAWDHPQYEDACRVAEQDGWNPWWIRSWNDVVAVLDYECYMDETQGRRVADFFPVALRHVKGRWAGKPFELFDWQKYDVTIPVFGWMRKNGTRRYRWAYIELPKKSGKSAWASGFGLYMLIGDDESGAEVYTAAIDRKQAGIVHDLSANMVRQSPKLSQLLTLVDSRKTIVYPKTRSKFVALSADVATHEGLDISGAVIDELHAHKKDHLFEVLKYGGAARTQPLFIVITTAGVYDPTAVGWDEHCFAERNAAGYGGGESWEYFSYICCAQKDDDWTDLSVIKRANPSLGLILEEDTFLADVRRIKKKPSDLLGFKRRRLNVWTHQRTRWMEPEAWSACGQDDLRLDDLTGRLCFGGLDLSTIRDMTALALVFPPHDTDTLYKLFVWFWLPADNIVERSEQTQAPYLLWAEQGRLELTPGPVVDYQIPRDKLLELAEQFALVSVAYDPYNATSIVSELKNDGIDMQPHRQGLLSMNAPIKEFEKLVLEKKIVHQNHPIMNWMVGNAEADYDTSGNVKIVKPDRKTSQYCVDGVIAATMALSQSISYGPVDSKGSTVLVI